MVLVVLVGGQLPGADRGVEGVRVGDEVRVSQVGGQVVCRGEGRRVGGRVALRRLGGHHHPADPCVVLQHLGKDKRSGGGGGEGMSGRTSWFSSSNTRTIELHISNGRETSAV